MLRDLRLIQLQPSAQSSTLNENFVYASTKLVKIVTEPFP